MKKLAELQLKLKVPKNQFNKFGDYRYRSCEDILEAVKPIASKLGLYLTLSDDVVLIGDRYYIKATASVIDAETGEKVETTAFAREAAEKKKMDDSQITGATSSYARKYALNGLLAIDDNKDADTDEYTNQQHTAKGKGEIKEAEAVAKERKAAETAPKQNAFDMSKTISEDDQKELINLMAKKGVGANHIIKEYGVPVSKLTDEQFANAIKRIMALPDKEINDDLQK